MREIERLILASEQGPEVITIGMCSIYPEDIIDDDDNMISGRNVI